VGILCELFALVTISVHEEKTRDSGDIAEVEAITETSNNSSIDEDRSHFQWPKPAAKKDKIGAPDEEGRKSKQPIR